MDNGTTSYLSIAEYERLAVKILYKMGCRFLARDPDFLGDCVRELMWADNKFNGCGTLTGYRTQRIKWIVGTQNKKLNKKTRRLISNFTDIFPKGVRLPTNETNV